MILSGVLANTATVAAGGALGVLFRKGCPERVATTLMHGLALCVLYVGISGALKGENIVVVIVSIVIGAILGELLNIDDKLQTVGALLQSKMNHSGLSISAGFVSSTLFVCVGAMAIVGSMQSGLSGSHETLYAKALIDGVVAVVMASTLGIGVAFSAVSVLVYETVLTLSANLISGYLTAPVINEMTCIGSLLIVAISLNMLKLTDIKVANLVPAPFLPIALSLLSF